jgi:DnaJ family protein C protein 3
MRSSKHLLFAFALPFFINHQVTAFEKNAKFYLEEGNQYLSTGKFNDAILSYDTAIRKITTIYACNYTSLLSILCCS